MRVLGFACFLLAASPAFSQSPSITRQPPSLTDAVERDEVQLSVEATGGDLRYLWHRNNVPLSNGTNATLRLNNIATNQAGTYYVLVSNVVSAARSSNALVRVVPDTFGPRILSAVVFAGDTNRVLVHFDDDLLRFHLDTNFSGFNPSNYVITEIGTSQRLTVTNVGVLVGGALTRLTVATNFNQTKNYQMCVYNLMDTRQNLIALNSCVPISFEEITNSVWFNSYWFFYESADPPPPFWNQPVQVDPNYWHNRLARFSRNLFGVPSCSWFGSLITFYANTYYFRTRFTVPDHLVGLEVSAAVGNVIDDGAVFYLNGTEVLRLNMPPGPISHETKALTNASPTQPTQCETAQVAIGHLLRETNLLAVEVHDFAATDFEAEFDASLTLNYLRTPVLTNHPPGGAVFLRYADESPTELRLYWTNGFGYALEHVEDLSQPWRELQPPSTNLVVNRTGPSRFFRLNKRH